MVTVPDIHLPRPPRAQHRPRQASPSQLNFLSTDPSLRTSRPPPCRMLPGRLLKTAEHLVRQPPLPPISIVRSCVQFCPSQSCNGPVYRMAEPLSSTKSENNEVEYIFVARHRILKLREHGPLPVRVGQRVSWHVFKPSKLNVPSTYERMRRCQR
ncbi:hypothetical protein F5888DRAFT_1696937 [Russula emetica]|nr:hypothetical protein F5888DRAFT_1696937 [Russula emetica]